MLSAARDPYPVDDDDLIMVDKEDPDGQSPKEGSKGSAPSKRKSKRSVSVICINRIYPLANIGSIIVTRQT